MTESNHLKALSTSPNELIVGNYIVLFGGRDLSGEFFTKNTRFESNYTEIGQFHVDFEHGLDVDGLGNNDDNVLGMADWKSAKIDERGIFVTRVLNRRASYVDFLTKLLEAGVIGTSSQAVKGKTARKPNGEIIDWPLYRDTLTLTPMEPRMVTENVLEAAKSLALAFPCSKSLASFTGKVIAGHETAAKTIEELGSLSEIERHLRDACGLSRSEATALVSRVKSVCRSDSGEREQLAALAEALSRCPVI